MVLLFHSVWQSLYWSAYLRPLAFKEVIGLISAILIAIFYSLPLSFVHICVFYSFLPFKVFFLLIYLWLHCVVITAHSHPSSFCEWVLLSSCSPQASHHGDFSCCRAQALTASVVAADFSSCGTWALEQAGFNGLVGWLSSCGSQA